MLELPRYPPVFVDDKKPNSFGLDAFVSDSGIPMRTVTAKVGQGFSMAIKYDGVPPSVMGEFMQFLKTIKYDAARGESAIAFFIPADHLLWELVPEREYIESEMLIQGSLNTALWTMTGFDAFSQRVINTGRFSFNVKNVWS